MRTARSENLLYVKITQPSRTGCDYRPCWLSSLAVADISCTISLTNITFMDEILKKIGSLKKVEI